MSAACTHQTLRDCSHPLHDEYWLTCDACSATFSYQQAYGLANARIDKLTAERDEARRERDAWIETSKQAYSGVEYYQGLLDTIGKMFGETAFTADDGTVGDSVLRAKVPELVVTLRYQIAALVEQLDEILHYEGGASSSIEDEYVMERANSLLASLSQSADDWRKKVMAEGEELALREILRQLHSLNTSDAAIVHDWISAHYFSGDLQLRYRPEVLEAEARRTGGGDVQG